MRNKINTKFLLITSSIVIIFFSVIYIVSYVYDNFYYKPQQLYNAIINNNYESIKSLTESGYDINNYKYNITSSSNAFDEACNTKNTSMAKRLVANGIDLDTKFDNGYNALFCATTLEDLQLCNMIINKGIDVYATNTDNLTVLDMAILNHSTKMINFYLDNYFELSSRNIRVSLCRDEQGTGQLTDIDALGTTKYLITLCTNNGIDTGLSELFVYANLGDSTRVLELITKENIHELSTDDQHMLSYICAAFCNIDTLKKLSKHDVDITNFNNYYIDTIRCAAKYNSLDVVKYLSNKCSDIAARHSKKNIDNYNIIDTTPLDYSIIKNDINMFNFLIEKGCTTSSDSLAYYNSCYQYDIQLYLAKIICETDDETIINSINKCVYNNNISAIETLLSQVKPSILIGKTFAGELTNIPSDSLIATLKKYDISIDYESLLINSIKNHNIYMVKYCVSNLKNLDFGDSEKNIPIAVAITCGDMDIFDYLIENCASLDISYSINTSIRNLANNTNYSKDVKKHIRNVTIKKEGFFDWF